jgi:transcriptional regulator with XRE-family HTH domain
MIRPVEKPKQPPEKPKHRRVLRAEIAARLKAAISESGVSQNALARMMRVSSGTLSSWTSGRTQPSLEEFSILCYGLDLSPRKILGVPEGGALRPLEDRSRDALKQSAVALAAFDEEAKQRRLNEVEVRLRHAVGEMTNALAGIVEDVEKMRMRRQKKASRGETAPGSDVRAPADPQTHGRRPPRDERS